jgi:hypothetical protein
MACPESRDDRRQRADGSLGPEERYAAPFGGNLPSHLVVGDVKRDGRPDIVLASGVLLQRVVPPGASILAQSVRGALRAVPPASAGR